MNSILYRVVACSLTDVCVQEKKRVDVGERLQQAKQSVTSYTSAIEHMKTLRDATLSDIEQCQLGLDVCLAAVAVCFNIVKLMSYLLSAVGHCSQAFGINCLNFSLQI